MAEELLINVNVTGEENIGNVDKSLDQVTNTAKKTTNAMATLRKEMRDAKAAMVEAEEGTEAYNNAMLKAASIADQMRDVNDKVKVAQKDVGVVANNVAGSISGLAGAFSTVQGVMGLFGAESEATTKAILKMQQIMAVTSGIAQMADALDSVKDLYGAVKLNITNMIAAKEAEIVASKANTVANVTEAGAITATGVAAKTSAKAILLSLGPIALVTAAIAAVTYGIMKLIEKISEVPRKIKLDIEMDKEVGEKLVDNFKTAYEFSLQYNAAVKSGNKDRIKGLAEVGEKEFGLNKTRLKMIGDNVDSWRIAFDDYLEMARLTYKQEFYIKRKMEAEANYEIRQNRIEDLGKQRKDLIKKLKKLGQKESDIEAAASADPIQMPLFSFDKKTEISKLRMLYDISNEYFDLVHEQYLKRDELLNANADLFKFEQQNQKDLEKLYNNSKTFYKPDKETNKKETQKKEVKLKKSIEQPTLDVAPTIVGLDKLDDSSKEFADINEKIVENEKLTNQQLERLNENKNVGDTRRLLNERKYLQQTLEIAQKELESAKQKYVGLKATYDNETNLLNERITKYNSSYQAEIDLQTQTKNQIEIIKAQMQAVEDNFNNTKDEKQKESLQKEYTNYENQLAILKNYLSESEAAMKDLDVEKDAIGKTTEKVNEIGNSVKDAGDKVMETNQAIVESNTQLALNSKDVWSSMMQDVQTYSSTAQGVFDAMADLNQAEIDSNNAKYDAIEEQIENSNMSEEEKTAALKKNEKERYKENLKAFEAQKKWQIASVLASSATSIAKTWEGYSSMGLVGAILAGVQTATIIASTLAQIKTIKAQRMDAPSESTATSNASSASSGTATIATASLSPSKTSMTTTDENINMMSNSTSVKDRIQTYVKVSEINNVQNKVNVSDKNSSY